MRADELLKMKVEDLERALSEVDDEGLLRYLLSAEKRKTAQAVIERRLAELASGLPAAEPAGAAASSEDLAPPVPPSPPSPPSLPTGPARVRLRLARALSFRGGGLKARQGDVVEVDRAEAGRLLASGLWEEVR